MAESRASIAERALRRLEAAVGAIYHARHPGPAARAVLARLRPLVLRTLPNDKWNLHVFVPEWLGALGAPPLAPPPRAKRIFLFCAYRIEFTLNVNLAILLAWRGHHVTIGYLPKLQSPVKEPRRDHPSARPYLAAALADVERLSAGRIRCVDLGDGATADVPVDEAFVARQARADVVQAMGKETLDPRDPEFVENQAYFEDVARSGQRAAWSHFVRHRDAYDLCLIPNGTTFEAAQFCHVAKQLGLPVNTFEKFAFRFARVINHGDNFLAFTDLDLAWELRRDAGWETEPLYGRACACARRLLDERRSNSTATWGWKLQTAPPETARDAVARIGVAPDTPFALVCTNIPYDAGYERLQTIFPSMKDWLLETVRALLDGSDLTVVVRVHPGEATYWGGREPSDQILRAAGVACDRLVVLPAATKVNTYGLMEACRFGSVFASTAGLEMAMLGKTVLVGTHVYYARRGFTIDPKDRDDYLARLVELATTTEPLGLTPEQARQACLFHFFLHCVMQWPYPYDKPTSVARRPPAVLLRDPEVRRYIATLDVLAMDTTEWRRAAVDHLRAGDDNHTAQYVREARA